LTDAEGVPIDGERGKQILAYAMNEGDVVLEFNEMDDGSLHVVDITEHVRQLERMHTNG